MGKLISKTPCAGLLPMRIGTVDVVEMDVGPIYSLQAFAGARSAVDKILLKDQDFALPVSGETQSSDGARILWFGKDVHMCLGFEPAEKISRHAALVDQSDGWAVVQISGDDVRAVLSRLVPIDVRGKSFAVGQTRRTLLEHVSVSLTRIDKRTFEIMAFRSMAKTLVHELERAMAHVSARSGN